MELEFDEDFKARLIKIIEDSLKGKSLSNSEAVILFHWVRNVNDPAYAWVPDKYKEGLANYTGGSNNG